jgi:CheY-like chemotaxis protein
MTTRSEKRQPDIEDLSNALVVDDHDDIREAVTAMLLELGVENVDVAANGGEAIEALRETRWDLLLLDLLMPGIDGFGVLNAIRAEDGILRPRLVVVMSAHVRATYASAIRTLGADDLLTKPFDLDDLASRIGLGD